MKFLTATTQTVVQIVWIVVNIVRYILKEFVSTKKL